MIILFLSFGFLFYMTKVWLAPTSDHPMKGQLLIDDLQRILKKRWYIISIGEPEKSTKNLRIIIIPVRA
jgi:hypothetical protein